ncbi:MAG: hypothetical protein V4675_09560 [Verrucomicrobiota bacterium]
MKAFPDSVASFAREQTSGGCDTLRHLLHGLRDHQGRIEDEVHAIRKLGKSVRGGFALFCLEKSAAREIQAVGRLLSGPRDAVTRWHTWNKLEWHGEIPLAAAVAARLEQQTHSAARRPPPETIAWCADRVGTAQQALQDVSADELPERLRKGLARLHRRVRQRCARLDHGVETDFHEARKAVKAWLGAVGFLPAGVIPAHPPMDELAEWLGDENDLAILSVWLADHGFNPRFAPGLWKTLRTARRRIQRKIIQHLDSREGRELMRLRPG